MSYGKPHPVALEMATIFEEHSMLFGGDSYLSETGWDMLQEVFGKVVPEMRASVYNDFARELYNRNIHFKPEIMQDRELAVKVED